ncbi:MAG TPA: hypothetical protein VMM14_05115 [Acidimicrobiia bacterium]|nr:hypothetical protein [Acidimicrobiia bacterium]
MSDDGRRIDREGIYIERDLADRIAIEEELDANIKGVYKFPSPSRRRIAGWVYLAAAAIAVFAFSGGWIVGLGLAALAAWQFLSSWPLEIDEHQAMTTAASAVDFPIGHSSASVRFQGWRSSPRWSVVLYSATEPPDQRALVVVDAVTGEIVETPYVESIDLV